MYILIAELGLFTFSVIIVKYRLTLPMLPICVLSILWFPCSSFVLFTFIVVWWCACVRASCVCVGGVLVYFDSFLSFVY